MCGIFFSAHARPKENGSYVSEVAGSQTDRECGLNSALLDRLSCRGPDASLTISRPGTASDDVLPSDAYARPAVTSSPGQCNHVDLTFHSTVLSLRGSALFRQPVSRSDRGNILCWNGEAWRIGDESLEYGESDTEVIFELLQKASTDLGSRINERAKQEADKRDEIVNPLMTIEGPFAFVYYNAPADQLYFGRDCIGRRSLIYKSDFDSSGALRFMLSSVGDGSSGWEEVPADGIYVLDLKGLGEKMGAEERIVHSMEDVQLDSVAADSNTLLQLPGIHIKHHSYHAFNKYASFNHTPPSPQQSRLTTSSPAVTELGSLLLAALSIRVRTIPGLQPPSITDPSALPNEHTTEQPQPHHPSSPPGQPPYIAALFSGGLDCTTLARLLHTLLPASHAIDLLTVAFHNPHIHKSSTPSPEIYASCPDRITALQSVTELRRVCPGRTWRLVEINVPFEEAMKERSTVAALMSPKCTEMDLSIAMALYFGARGAGIVRHTADVAESDHTMEGESDNAQAGASEHEYVTPARILLSGLGADELFGGYARHATAFARAGYAGLTAELALDVRRLGSRNLGRDDRVVSHWGREVRYPFLDEKVMRWAVEKGVGELCGFGMASSEEDVANTREDTSTIEDGKLVLRILAHKLGMHQVAREKKRAIQFGARTAKMHGKTSGTAAMSMGDA